MGIDSLRRGIAELHMHLVLSLAGVETSLHVRWISAKKPGSEMQWTEACWERCG